MDGNNRKNICRLCLYRSECLIYIFEEYSRHSFVVAQVISDLLHCDINKADGYPQFICPRCLVKLEDFYIFRKQCVDSKYVFDRDYSRENTSRENCNPEIVNFIPIVVKQEVEVCDVTDLQPQQDAAENDHCSRGSSLSRPEGVDLMERTNECSSNVTTPTEKKKLQGAWSQNDLQQAMEAVKRGMSTYKAERQFGIPRTSLRRYIEFGVPSRTRRGHSSILTREMPKQCDAAENDHCSREGSSLSRPEEVESMERTNECSSDDPMNHVMLKYDEFIVPDDEFGSEELVIPDACHLQGRNASEKGDLQPMKQGDEIINPDASSSEVVELSDQCSREDSSIAVGNGEKYSGDRQGSTSNPSIQIFYMNVEETEAERLARLNRERQRRWRSRQSRETLDRLRRNRALRIARKLSQETKEES